MKNILNIPALRGGVDEMTGPATLTDKQGQLHSVRVAGVVCPQNKEELQRAVRQAAERRMAVSVGGGRHAMGGQQFGRDTLHIDTRSLNGVLNFDRDKGLIEVEAGVSWAELVPYLIEQCDSDGQGWAIRQKQTGADRLTIGGAVGANIHGRGLQLKPFIDDIESLILIEPDGDALRCSRTENGALFRFVVGGYGLFGIVYSVTLRLVPRTKVQRRVCVETVDTLIPAFDAAIADGATYGDFQYATDPNADTFLHEGVLATYRPVDGETAVPTDQRVLAKRDWQELVHLAHVDQSEAYRRYRAHYESTDRQIYWSDAQQLSPYLERYHEELDQRLGARCPGSEVITEIYVPRDRLGGYLAEVRAYCRRESVHVIYGTIRLIERDRESFLVWARQPWVCIVINLHVDHTRTGKTRAARAFQYLIDAAIGHEGSFYLTYHRFATRAQVEACYPQIETFLHYKRVYDPDERIQSDWYRHYRNLFAAQ
jgi:FAD/FMN-containing dehydrogenase